MDELVVVEVVATQAEAELLCSLLRSEGIRCTHRVSITALGQLTAWQWAVLRRSSSAPRT
jgi:hypothetical protein